MIVVERDAYRLEVSDDGLRATVAGLTLRPHAAFATVGSPDETLEVLPPRRVGDRIELERRSTLWDRAVTTIACTDTQIELRFAVRGRGDLDAAELLALRSLLPHKPSGLLPSGYAIPGVAKLFCPDPAHATGVRPVFEPAVIGVLGDGEPGRHHWFFTPGPLYLAWGDEGEREWIDLGVAAPVEELSFTELAYVPRDGVTDPYEGLRRHRDDLAARGAAPPVEARERPDWWQEPIFCGWGAQVHLGETSGRPAAEFASQERYDAFLGRLDSEGVAPGTVVLDDKWQTAYGTNEPDEAKWPDLRAWIARRHERGQKVLLWWKAWDPEGLGPELCIRNPDGAPVALDPTNPDAREELTRQLAELLSPDGLDADGLKIDFTARAPSGYALELHGDTWGIALLHELLAVVHAAAKAAKPEALLVTQVPHPAFADVADMIRLNDMIGGHASVVPQMRFRAAVSRAACPELLVDTDDWRVPSREAWREYLEAKPELGVPSLYYATHVDATGEELETSDYHLLRSVWDRWQRTRR